MAIDVEQRLVWTTVRVPFIIDAPREQSCSGVHGSTSPRRCRPTARNFKKPRTEKLYYVKQQPASASLRPSRALDIGIFTLWQ